MCRCTVCVCSAALCCGGRCFCCVSAPSFFAPLLSSPLSPSPSPAGEPAPRARSQQHHPSSAPVCSLLIPRRRQTRARDETWGYLDVHSIPLPLSLCVPPCSCARCRPLISSSLSSCSSPRRHQSAPARPRTFGCNGRCPRPVLSALGRASYASGRVTERGDTDSALPSPSRPRPPCV